MYNPNPDGSGSHQGGAIAAPVASQILSDILPHLGIASTATDEQKDSLITLSDVSSKSLSDARSILEASGFKIVLKASSDASTTVVSQYPKSGTALQTGSIVCLYTEGAEKTMKQVPDLKGKSADQARNSLQALNLNMSVQGSGVVVSQDIVAGTEVEEGTVVNLTLKDEMVGGAQ